MKLSGIAPVLGLLLIGVIGLFPPVAPSCGGLIGRRGFLFDEGFAVDGGRLLGEALVVVSAFGLWLLARGWIDRLYSRV